MIDETALSYDTCIGVHCSCPPTEREKLNNPNTKTGRVKSVPFANWMAADFRLWGKTSSVNSNQNLTKQNNQLVLPPC